MGFVPRDMSIAYASSHNEIMLECYCTKQSKIYHACADGLVS